MTPSEQITAATEAMEAEQWRTAISLLVELLSRLTPASETMESAVRVLLAQALHGSGESVRAMEQARAALVVAEKTNDRGLIWKCMALIASMEIIETAHL